MDVLNYSILWCIHNREKPLWKAKIYDCVMNCPFPTEQVAVQTVGRRVDQLMQDDYLQTTIVEPENLDRDLAIAFQLSEKGEAALETERKQLIRDVVKHNLFGNTRELPKDALITLIQNEYSLDDDSVKTLEQYSRKEIQHLLCMEYMEHEALNTFNHGCLEEFHKHPPGKKITSFLSERSSR